MGGGPQRRSNIPSGVHVNFFCCELAHLLIFFSSRIEARDESADGATSLWHSPTTSE